MVSVSGINSARVNFSAKMGSDVNSHSSTSDNKLQADSVKKYFTVTNAVLGSLAMIGVLGMADMLLCRGKHINKLTGKSEKLEQTVKNLENKLSVSEEKCTELENKLVEQSKKIKEAANLNADSKFNNDSWAHDVRNIYSDAYGIIEEGKPELAKPIMRRTRIALSNNGYKLTDAKELILTKPNLFKIEYAHDADHFHVVAPALYRNGGSVDEIGEVIEKGLVYAPASYRDKLASLSEKELKAIIQNPKMWNI